MMKMVPMSISEGGNSQSLDWDQFCESHGGVFSSLEVFSCSPVFLFFGQVVLDSAAAEEVVFAGCLCQFLGVLKLKSPGLN